MDVFKNLSEKKNYSRVELEAIVGAWVLAAPFEGAGRVDNGNGHIEEEDYDKRSIYSILYAIYRSAGYSVSDKGVPYEFTFNTWGYAWPESFGPAPVPNDDPERFGKNAYTGLFHFQELKDFIEAREGKVHVVELGCGTGAGADLICTNVLPKGTYHAFDMQAGAIATAQRKFVGRHNGRLMATRADATAVPASDNSAQVVTVCETHVTDQGAALTEEDQRFFQSMNRVLEPGGYFTWGNAIPAKTWDHATEYLASLGFERRGLVDVNGEAIEARRQDAPRIEAYVEHALNMFLALKSPFFGPRRRKEAALAMKNLCRHPGTRLFDDMVNRRDLYQVALFRKAV